MIYFELKENKGYQHGNDGFEAFRAPLQVIEKKSIPEWYKPDEEENVKWIIPFWCGLEYVKDSDMLIHCSTAYEKLSLAELLKTISDALETDAIKEDTKRDIDNAAREGKLKYLDTKDDIFKMDGLDERQQSELSSEISAVRRFLDAYHLEHKEGGCSYAFEMPTLFEIFVACKLRMLLQEKKSNLKVCTQDEKTIFDPACPESYIDGTYRPDILIKENGKTKMVLDVKYKSGEVSKHTREDRLQILAYAFMEETDLIGHVFPEMHIEPPMMIDLWKAEGHILYHELCCNCIEDTLDTIFENL